MNVSNLNLIGVHGKIGAGKDTLSIYLLTRLSMATMYAFAQPLKDGSRAMFGFSEEQLYGTQAQKGAIDPFWGFSPREVFQKLGTGFGRNMLRDDVWLKRAELEVMRNNERGFKTIISDVRYENEAELIRRLGGIVIHVLGPTNPEHKSEHSSEDGIEVLPNDIVIINDKSLGLDNFYESINQSLLTD